MKGTRAALRYAKATLNLAKEQNLADEVNADMCLLIKTISDSSDLQYFINNPVIKSDVKKEGLHAIFKDKITSVTLGLINLLITNKRLSLLYAVAKEYLLIYDFDKGIEIAQITTAIPLTENVQNKFLEKINQLTSKKVSVENKVDPSIIGGFIIRVGDKQFDSSISGQLNILKRNFEDNYYISQL